MKHLVKNLMPTVLCLTMLASVPLFAQKKAAPATEAAKKRGAKPQYTITQCAMPGGYQAKLVQYRDYLRSIYTGPSNSNSYHAYRQKLERRFHQKFATTVTKQKPANQVLIPILKQILTAPRGIGYGFNISAGTIKPQGELSDREYLDYLIGLTNLSAKELGLRYRLRQLSISQFSNFHKNLNSIFCFGK